MLTSFNGYEILGVSPRATRDEILRAWRRKALEFHPDRAPGREQEFVRVTEAKDLLLDPVRKAEHDRAIAVEDFRNAWCPGTPPSDIRWKKVGPITPKRSPQSGPLQRRKPKDADAVRYEDLPSPARPWIGQRIRNPEGTFWRLVDMDPLRMKKLFLSDYEPSWVIELEIDALVERLKRGQQPFILLDALDPSRPPVVKGRRSILAAVRGGLESVKVLVRVY